MTDPKFEAQLRERARAVGLPVETMRALVLVEAAMNGPRSRPLELAIVRVEQQLALFAKSGNASLDITRLPAADLAQIRSRSNAYATVEWLRARGFAAGAGLVAEWTLTSGVPWRIYDEHAVIEASPGVVLLWALALEIDEHHATETGDRVCRACGDRGERIVVLDQGTFVDPNFMAECRRHGGRIDESPPQRTTVRMHVLPRGQQRPLGDHGRYGPDNSRVENVLVPRTRLVVRPCGCVPPERQMIDAEPIWPPTRPDTVSLEWLVRRLAAAWPFAVATTGFPELWQAKIDEWLATDETHWIAQWWVAFWQWACAGVEPDVDQLARLLAMRIPALRRREQADRGHYDLSQRIAWLDNRIFDLMIELVGDLTTMPRIRADWLLSDVRVEAGDERPRITTRWLCDGWTAEATVSVSAIAADADMQWIEGSITADDPLVRFYG